MDRTLLYYASMGIVGLSSAAGSVPDLLAGRSSISLWLMALGGVGLVLGSLYEYLSGRTDDFDPGRLTWIVVVGALLSVVGWSLSVLG